MPKLSVVTPRKLLKVLSKLGFQHIHGKGSHMFLAHPDGRKTAISMHAGDIPKGTLLAILHDMKITREELANLL
jgi:predicted RNA binding protein YcfA (HicA-like mRNA interferase family)